MQGWQPWLDDGMGRPNPFPTALPYFVVMGWATSLLAPRVELALFLVAIFVAAFGFATLFARRAFGLGWAAYACGVLYLVGPVVLTKLVAGHLSYLQAYAVFPLFALGLREGAHSVRWSAAGALAAAVTALQAQFLGFDAAYALLALACGAVRPAGVARVALLGVPLVLPVLIGPTVNALGGAGTLSPEHANVAWEVAQSSDPLLAIVGLGYFTHYVNDLTVAGTAGLIAVVPLLALAGVVATRLSADARALVASLAAGWLVVAGLNGPLGPVLAALFEHVTPASLFRELYDATVLIWFPLAVLAAVALQRLGGVTLAAATVALGVALAPPWAAYGGYFTAAPSPERLARVAALADSDAAPGRVVWWPALQPIGPASNRQGGSDPLARTRLAGELPLYEYQPDGTDGAAVSLAANGRWDAARRDFAWLGVRHVVVREGLVSFASGAPRATPGPGGALEAVGSSGSFTVYRVGGARGLVTVEPGVPDAAPPPRPYAPSRTETVPRPDAIVAAFPYIWETPAAASCGPDAVIGGGATLAGAGGPWIFAAPPGQDDCRWRPASSLAAQPRTLFVAGGSADSPGPPGTRPRSPLATATSLRERPGHWAAVVDAPRAGLLVVRTAYDARWRAEADGRDLGPPREWFGFPAWPIGAGRHAIVARYGGAAIVLVALVISLAAQAVAAALIAWPAGRAIRPGGSRR